MHTLSFLVTLPSQNKNEKSLAEKEIIERLVDWLVVKF